MGELKTYSVRAPLATHFRPATCEEVGCLDHHHGWRVRVDALSPADLHAMETSGRHHTVHEIAAGETWWVFPAGQPCFRASTHQAPIGKPELYVVRDRGETRRFDRPDQWADDCATHTTRIVDKIMEG